MFGIGGRGQPGIASAPDRNPFRGKEVRPLLKTLARLLLANLLRSAGLLGHVIDELPDAKLQRDAWPKAEFG